jgi:serine/threonine-protein kinase RsbW
VTSGEHVRSGLALPQALDEVHGLLEEVAGAHPEVDASDLMRLETALVELVGNIIEHGRPPGEVSYGVRVHVEADELVALLSDDAVDVAPSPDGAALLDDDLWAESGRGLALAGAIVDELVHEPHHPGNCWRLRQRRSESAS